MGKLKIEKDNVVLSIDEEDLAQYEERGYTKVGAAKKVAPEKLEKEVAKLTEEVDKLTAGKEALEETNKKLTEEKEELAKEVEKLTTDKEALEERISKLEESKTEKTGDPKESNNKK